MLCRWMCTCVALGVLVLTPGPVEAGYGKTCSPERRREGPAARGMCGTHLSDALSVVCGGIFSVAKRSEQPSARTLKDIIANKQDALDYLGKRSSGLERTGVVCECCYHKCNIMEMLEYCGSSRKRSLGLLSKHPPSTVDQPSLDDLDQW
ncbi:molluscan insulin-related peptide 3-like [Liolophura sinensis]|uniref:molluscan insulin-related peptide 3-like n=1 Tax=Liolophura sinensis TaxID=3198878 RepID=UPI00315808D7